jgi:hypothetical protein
MNEQPEALWLANELDGMMHREFDVSLPNKASKELRRLHAEVLEQCRINGMGQERELKLMAEKQDRQPLTDEEILHRVDTHVGGVNPGNLDNSDWIQFARSIEAAHGIKK